MKFSMLMTHCETCCDFFLAVLDGKYGWVDEAATILAIVIIFNFFVKALLKRLHLRFAKQHRPWQDSFVRALYKPLSYYVWLIALLFGINIVTEQLIGENAFAQLHLLVAIGGVLALSWFLLRWKKNIVEFMIAKSKRHEIAMDTGKVDVIGKVVTMLILFIMILLLLEVSNRSMNTLIAFGGIGGLAIAFASQEIIASFFGGFMIYLTKPFTIGDWILLTEKNIEGHVEEIGWYMTCIRTFDKRPIYVPNSLFTKIVVMNPSRMSHRQIKEVIAIRYSDLPILKNVLDALRAALKKHPDVDSQQRIIVNFISFGSSSLEILIDLYVFATDSQDFSHARENILLQIGTVLTEQGSALSFPTTIVEIPDGILLRKSNTLKEKKN